MQKTQPAFEIRAANSGDLGEIETLYPLAFPDEDLVPLVRDLAAQKASVLACVASDGTNLIGHGAFTLCQLDAGSVTLALLGPLAVTPAWQRRGVGRSLIEAGVDHLKDKDVVGICVLGDPAYYSRFGFSDDHDVAAPYTLPTEWAAAWRFLDLTNGSVKPSGKLTVPGPWAEPALWQP